MFGYFFEFRVCLNLFFSSLQFLELPLVFAINWILNRDLCSMGIILNMRIMLMTTRINTKISFFLLLQLSAHFERLSGLLYTVNFGFLKFEKKNYFMSFELQHWIYLITMKYDIFLSIMLKVLGLIYHVYCVHQGFSSFLKWFHNGFTRF